MKDTGWVPAGSLEEGDNVKLLTGIYAPVEKYEIELLREPVTVYNFHVEDYECYYVSEQQVLVHNKCKTPDSDSKDFIKLKNGQGYKDKRKYMEKDMKHKDHWDISDRKGKKIKEIDFKGNKIWPNGSKNKNKKGC